MSFLGQNFSSELVADEANEPKKSNFQSKKFSTTPLSKVFELFQSSFALQPLHNDADADNDDDDDISDAQPMTRTTKSSLLLVWSFGDRCISCRKKIILSFDDQRCYLIRRLLLSDLACKPFLAARLRLHFYSTFNSCSGCADFKTADELKKVSISWFRTHDALVTSYANHWTIA